MGVADPFSFLLTEGDYLFHFFYGVFLAAQYTCQMCCLQRYLYCGQRCGFNKSGQRTTFSLSGLPEPWRKCAMGIDLNTREPISKPSSDCVAPFLLLSVPEQAQIILLCKHCSMLLEVEVKSTTSGLVSHVLDQCCEIMSVFGSTFKKVFRMITINGQSRKKKYMKLLR